MRLFLTPGVAPSCRDGMGADGVEQKGPVAAPFYFAPPPGDAAANQISPQDVAPRALRPPPVGNAALFARYLNLPKPLEQFGNARQTVFLPRDPAGGLPTRNPRL